MSVLTKALCIQALENKWLIQVQNQRVDGENMENRMNSSITITVNIQDKCGESLAEVT